MSQQQMSHDMEPENDSNIDLEDSANMNEDERALFLNIQKSQSNDSFLGKFVGNNSEVEKRPLVLSIPDIFGSRPSIFGVPEQPKASNPPATKAYRVFKKQKKPKKHNKCDYQKNICGYVTKKIIRQFTGETFEAFVEDLCQKYYSEVEEVKKFYLSKTEYVTGPSHIPHLLTPQTDDDWETIGYKLVFREFYEWFLKERYFRYLLLEGKMTNKKAYIEYKNNTLAGFIEQDRERVSQIFKERKKQREEETNLKTSIQKVSDYRKNRSSSSNEKSSSRSNFNPVIL